MPQSRRTEALGQRGWSVRPIRWRCLEGKESPRAAYAACLGAYFNSRISEGETPMKTKIQIALLAAFIIGMGYDLWLDQSEMGRECKAKGGRLDFGMHCYRIDLHRIDLD